MIVVIVLVRGRASDSGAAPRTSSAATAGTAGAGSSSPSSSGDKPLSTKHIRRLDPEQRKQLAAQIAAAQAARASGGASARSTPKPKVPEHEVDLEHISMSVKDALTEAIPLLADCYKTTATVDAATHPTAKVMMTLSGDPDIGTLIDPADMVDGEKKPLEATLGDCLRSTLESMQLPPLDEGENVQVQFSFVFE